SSSASVQVVFETSPSADEGNFTALAPPVTFGTAAPFVPASTTPTVVRSVRSRVTANLARYVRWKIVPSTTGLWDLTFRVRVTPTRSSAFAPTDIAGCCLWLRSDLGVTVPSGTAITAWNDQSGLNNHAIPGTSPNYAVINGVNGLPRINVASGQTL